MNKTIEISDSIYDRLKKHIVDFDDTPSTIVKKLLDYYDKDVQAEQVSIPTNRQIGKDHSHYQFNEFVGKKGEVVMQVIKCYIKQHDGVNYEQLIKAFPKKLQGGEGVILKLSEAKNKISKSKNSELQSRRYFLSDAINLSDGTSIVVCNQWGSTTKGVYDFDTNFPRFGKHCKDELGYMISRIDGEIT